MRVNVIHRASVLVDGLPELGRSHFNVGRAGRPENLERYGSHSTAPGHRDPLVLG